MKIKNNILKISLLVAVFTYLFISCKQMPLQDKKLASVDVQAINNKKLNRPPKKDRPDLALAQDIERTKNPITGEPDYEARAKALQYTAKKIKEKAAIGGVNWVERGPNNVGGRTRALMFDPNDITKKKVWAGGVAGGLWYNNDITDANSSWNKISDFWSNLAVTCIAYNPNNTQEMYVGTGEGWFNGGAVRGEGIWKTTNGGTTWNQLASTVTFYRVQKIVITSGGVIIVSDRNNGFYRSIDGGASWTNTLTGERGADLEIATNGDVYGTTGVFTQGNIYKSTNNGATWALNFAGGTNAGRIEIATAPSNSNVVYAVCNDLSATGNNDVLWFKKTTNGGTSWSDITIPKYVTTPASCVTSTTHFTRAQCWYDLILKVHPTDANLVIAGGIDLHRSTNGGTAWTPISFWYSVPCLPYVHADQHAMEFRPGNNNEMIFGNDGGVFYSTNAGNSGVAAPHTIDARNKNYNVTQFYAVGTKNMLNSAYFVAGAQDNGSKVMNGFQTKPGNEVTGGDGAFCFIDQDNPDIQITSYVNNNYYRSLDGGISFPTILADDNTGDFINTATYDSGTNILYTNKCTSAGGAPFNLYRVSNINTTPTIATISFTTALSNKVTALEISPNTSNKLFMGTNDGNVYYITGANTGTSKTATKITASVLAAGTVSSIDIGATDNQILVTLSNYGINSVFETLDGGTTWTNKDTGSLPDMPIRWGLYNPDNRNQVVLATEAGIYTTDNFNAAPVWGTSNNGLANVRCDMLQYRAIDKTIVVATHGRGIYTSDIFVTNPLADFEADVNSGCGSLTVNFTDGSLKSANSWAWDVDNNGVTDYTTQNPTHTYSTPGLYAVKLTVANGQSVSTKNSYINVIASAPTAGCAIVANSNVGNGVGISKVQLGGIENKTALDDGTSQDYSCTQSTVLLPNTTYTINVGLTDGLSMGSNVYIDYNNNGDFTDAGENVASFALSTTALRTTTFTTPAAPTFNTPLRMRVTSRSTNMPTSCNVGTYGQYEDYTIIIAPTITWTGTTSTDWNVTTNWSSNIIPTSYNDVVIPTGVTNYPILNANNAICRNFTLNSNANFTMGNNSVLTARGVFNSNGNFFYAGTTAQLVQTKFANFNNLTINNINGVKLQANVNLTGTLTIQSGKLDLNNFNVDLGTTGTIVEDRANNHYITDNTTGINETNKGGYVRFSNRTTNGTLTQIAGTGIHLANAGTVTIDRHHYKATSFGTGGTIKKVYHITGTPTNATMRIEYAAAERATIVSNSNAKLFKYNGATWQLQGGTWTNATPHYVELTNINSFSPWSVGNNSDPLPVSLVSFTAQRQTENQVKLTWTTATEINNQGFDIEKSIDGIIFEKIGFVDGLGNSSVGKTYTFIDQNQDAFYYRLKQKDFNNDFAYSEIKFVEGNGNDNLIVFPNPTIGNISLKLPRKVNPNIVGKIRLVDINGKEIRNFEGKMGQAESILKTMIPDLEAGVYVIDVRTTAGNWQQKLIKE
ncbi:MAG: PKD domain-containing protein [Bacteroidetes bacterium]|nr:MAG: PKD domain-containing protein [Bacteroidota bacterium]